MKNYRFEVSCFNKKISSIIVRSSSVQNARSDAHGILHGMFGGNYTIKTSAQDAKVMRRMPANIDGCYNAYDVNDAGVKVYWAWLVFA